MAQTATLPIRSDGGALALIDRMGNRIVLVLLAVMVTLAGAGAGGALLLKPAASHGSSPSAAQASVGRAASAPAFYAALPAMTFTLTDGDRLRELRVRAVLEFDPATPKEAVTPHLARIADAMTLRMLDADPADLRGPQGAAYLKDALRFAAGKALRPLKLRQVLIQDMLMR